MMQFRLRLTPRAGVGFNGRRRGRAFITIVGLLPESVAMETGFSAVIVPPRLEAPVVLVHGLSGFSRLVPRREAPSEYFPGIPPYLAASGNRILCPRVTPTASVSTRALELRAILLKELGSQPFHLIGHSQGGLDARYLISRLGMDNQVISLTTVGTPHRGTAFADWGIARLARFVCPLLRWARIPDHAFFELTTECCRQFNESTPDVPGVRYYSVAGVCEEHWLNAGWRWASRLVGRIEGPNDGIVSVASATWGERTDIWAGDHLSLVNWPNRRMKRAGESWDRTGDYARILGQLA